MMVGHLKNELSRMFMYLMILCQLGVAYLVRFLVLELTYWWLCLQTHVPN
jgi:hypothetical protein